MHPDVAALLAVQDVDVTLHELESRRAALQPRLDTMARERDKARLALAQAQQSAAAEEKRRQDVAARVAQHRALQEKNQAALNNVTSMREATAATAQLEQAKRMIDEDERELSQIGQRLMEANRLADERSTTADELEIAQAEARDSLAADQQAIDQQLGDARAERQRKAATVPRALLSKYERLRSSKRVHAVYPLHGNSCGHCDTMIPLQRRSIMVGTGATEICEGCGVMLYASE
jgi:predicted  nucleic acid-binding Zn-ribbon protein